MSRILDIVLIAPGSSRDGPTLGALAVAKLLRDSHSITLLVLGPPAEWILRYCADSIRVIFITGKRWSVFSVVKGVSGALQAHNLTDRYILLTFGLRPDFYGLFIRPRKRISSIRAINHANYSFTYGNIIGWFLHVIHDLLLRWYDVVIVMYPAMANQFSGAVRKKTFVIPNMVEQSISFEKTIISERIAPKELCLITVGSLTPRKNHIAAISLLRLLMDQGVHAVLHIYGEGEMLYKLRDHAQKIGVSNSIEFCGFQIDVVDRYRNYDVYVTFSYSEGCSRAVLEALNAGLPVIMSDCPSARDLSDGSSGVTIVQTVAEAASVLRSFSPRQGSYIYKNLLPSNYKASYIIDRYQALFGI